MQDEYLTVKELSDYIKVKPKTLYFWAAQKKIPFYKIHGCIRFKKSEIDQWLTNCQRNYLQSNRR